MNKTRKLTTRSRREKPCLKPVKELTIVVTTKRIVFLLSSGVFILCLSGCMRTFNKAVVKNNPYRASITTDLSGNWLATYRGMHETSADEKAAKIARRNQIINEFV